MHLYKSSLALSYLDFIALIRSIDKIKKEETIVYYLLVTSFFVLFDYLGITTLPLQIMENAGPV